MLSQYETALILRLDLYIESLEEVQLPLIIDANAEYRQTEMEGEDADMKTFVTHHKLYCHTKMTLVWGTLQLPFALWWEFS